jgi:hypothetical protein
MTVGFSKEMPASNWIILLLVEFFFERPHLYFKRLLNYIRDYGNRVVINGKRKRWVTIIQK